jgi:hypothetical protein
VGPKPPSEAEIPPRGLAPNEAETRSRGAVPSSGAGVGSATSDPRARQRFASRAADDGGFSGPPRLLGRGLYAHLGCG